MTTIIPDPAPIPAPNPASRQVPGGDAYEDATVYSSGVVLHPLPGRPHFDGVLEGPDGLMARFQDGDLVIRADLAAIDAWTAELELARRELTANERESEVHP
jgi:hypothetical protein